MICSVSCLSVHLSLITWHIITGLCFLFLPPVWNVFGVVPSVLPLINEAFGLMEPYCADTCCLHMYTLSLSLPRSSLIGCWRPHRQPERRGHRVYSSSPSAGDAANDRVRRHYRVVFSKWTQTSCRTSSQGGVLPSWINVSHNKELCWIRRVWVRGVVEPWRTQLWCCCSLTGCTLICLTGI